MRSKQGTHHGTVKRSLRWASAGLSALVCMAAGGCAGGRSPHAPVSTRGSAIAPGCALTGQAIAASARPSAGGPELLGIQLDPGGDGWGQGEIPSPRGAELTPAVWRTTDGGKTWLDVAPTPLDATSLEEQAEATYSFVSDAVAWVALTSQAQLAGKQTDPTIFRTTDGGRCWSSARLPVEDAGTPISLDAINGTTAYLLLTTAPAQPFLQMPGTLLVTHDGGGTWSPVARKPGALPYPGMVTFASQSAGLLTAGDNTDPDAYVTTNGGVGWRPVTLPASGCDGYRYQALDVPTFFGTAGFMEAQTLAPHLPGAPSGDGVLGTSDGGATWRWLKIPWCGPEVSDFLNARDGWVWAWSPLNTTKPVRGRFFHTTDGGKTWSTIAPDATLEKACCQFGNGLDQLDFTSATVGWALTNTSAPNNVTSNAVLETVDGGQNWKVVWQQGAA